MDTIASKTPDPLPFARWRELGAAPAAREVHRRVADLPEPLRRAALAWLRPESELAADLARGRGSDSGAARSAPLLGVPYFLKDLFDLAGVSTRAGSTFLERVRSMPTRDSAIVSRLRAAGAACAGKTHLVEFASGLTGENPHYGDCPHPRFADRLAGGSSSGSAALVGAGVIPFAIGTDTGGSVRVPAAWCGLHGFRLAPGDEFIRDAFPLAPTMDTCGWFTANAADMRLVWRILVPAASRIPESPNPPGVRGCYLNARKLVPDMDPAVATACDYAAASLSVHADPVAEASLLLAWHRAVDAYVTIGMSEAHVVHREWLVPHRADYDPLIWQRFTDAGAFTPAQIEEAHACKEMIRSVWRDFFRTYDYLVLPAVPTVAPTKAEATAALRKRILTLTAPASLGGLPVLTIPVQVKDGLTGGLQVIVPHAASPAISALLREAG